MKAEKPFSEFVVDNDKPTRQDTLDRKDYAEAFARLAETPDNSLVVALYGGWGVGKTSLMQLIEDRLDTDKTLPVWFDPWQHQFDDNPALALMHALVKAAGLGEELKKTLMIIGGILGSMVLRATTSLSLQSVKKMGEAYEEERFQVQEERVRLKEHFEEIIKRAQHESPDFTQGKRKKIVFFIDDLDRCMPEQVLKMLEALKLYLDFPGCVYFIGVDRGALENSIHHHYKDVKISGADYLDKIVQLPFYIPPIAEKHMDNFIAPFLKGDVASCKYMLVSLLGDNPRSVKRFINTLTFQNMFAERRIPDYDVKILALILLIQHRDNMLFDQILQDPRLPFKLKSKKDEVTSISEKHLDGDPKLKELILDSEITEQTFLSDYLHLTELIPVEVRDVDSELAKPDLKKILKEHALWLNSNKKDGKRAELIAADLSWAKLSGVNLSEAELSGVNLSGVNLTKAKLRGVNLSRANLQGANLQMAALQGANLKGADLQGANLIDSDLRDVELQGANLSKAYLLGVNLSRFNLTETNLTEANLRKANLNMADLSKATLTRADLSAANLSKATLIETKLYDADLSMADLSGADLSRAILSRANLNRANLNRANLSAAILSKAILHSADLCGANLSGADLSGADLSGADLTGAILNRANLSVANLSRANLRETKITKDQIINVKYDNKTVFPDGFDINS